MRAPQAACHRASGAPSIGRPAPPAEHRSSSLPWAASVLILTPGTCAPCRLPRTLRPPRRQHALPSRGARRRRQRRRESWSPAGTGRAPAAMPAAAGRRVRRSGPVRMNPAGSRSTRPAAMSDLGVEPMKMNMAAASSLRTARASPQATSTASSRSAPCAATTSARGRTSMLAASVMRSTRYWDIPSASAAPRTSIVTFRAYRAKLRAAWPAELAPPTMSTSFPRHAAASVSAAP